MRDLASHERETTIERRKHPLRIAMLGDYPVDSTHIAGGVESVMLYLCRGLVAQGNLDLHAVTLDRWRLGARQIQEQGYTVHYVPQGPGLSRIRNLMNIRRLCTLLDRLKPDLIHVHIAGKYSDAAYRSRLPWILTLHGIRYLEEAIKPGLINRLYRRWIFSNEELRGIRRARFVVAINPFVNECFNGKLRGQVFEIENPVETRFFELPQHNEPGRLLYVGRLTPRKDIMTLLRAMREIHAHQTQVKLRLAGTGDAGDPFGYVASLHHYVQQENLEDCVTFLGPLPEHEILEEYAQASLVVQSARLETAPMAITQSLAAATAVVTTDAGGSRYLIDEGRTGRVVPCVHPAALAQAVLEMLREDARVLEPGRQGREVAQQRFHMERIAAKNLSAYQTVLREVGQVL